MAPAPPIPLPPAAQQYETLTARQVCRMLKIHPNKLSKLARHEQEAERIPRFLVGGRYRYRLDQLVYWLDNHQASL